MRSTKQNRKPGRKSRGSELTSRNMEEGICRGGGRRHKNRPDFGPRGGGRHGYNSGRRRGVLKAAELRLVILKLISEEPRHGYDVIRAIEDKTGGQYAPSPGVVYPALSFMEDEGLISQVEAKGARKAFEVTEEGTAKIAEVETLIHGLLNRLTRLSDAGRGVNLSPVKRAMENMRVAIRGRTDRDEVDEETVHKIAALLDEVSQKIERL